MIPIWLGTIPHRIAGSDRVHHSGVGLGLVDPKIRNGKLRLFSYPATATFLMPVEEIKAKRKLTEVEKELFASQIEECRIALERHLEFHPEWGRGEEELLSDYPENIGRVLMGNRVP